MGTNYNRDETYSVDLTMRSRMSYLPEIKKRLEGTPRDALFRGTCFGKWLDISYWRLEGHLVHLLLQMQVDLGRNHDPLVDSLIYEVGTHLLKFGAKEFCLITGLRFGNIDWEKYKAPRNIPFRDRVFPKVKTESIHVTDILELYNDGTEFLKLKDDDAVCVCLLLVLELVFLGVGGDKNTVVDPYFLALVENLDEWNRFPWGSHIWLITHAQLKDAVPTRRTKHLRSLKLNPPKKAKYTLSGFIWAFKIWILEAFPVAREWWLPREEILPRGIRWVKNLTFNPCHNYLFTGPFQDPNNPRPTLTLLAAEAQTDWWLASRDFFEHLADDGDTQASNASPQPSHAASQAATTPTQPPHAAFQAPTPPLQPPTASPPSTAQVPSLEEFLKLKQFCIQLHERCLMLERRVFMNNQNQDLGYSQLTPTPDVHRVPDPFPSGHPDNNEYINNNDFDLNIGLNYTDSDSDTCS